MDIIKPFDPWKSKLCTCPEKFSLNPYTGCSHKCTYCYSTYIPNFYSLRTKKDVIKRVEKDLEKIPENSIISMSNSSDPYPGVERKLEITRKILELLKEYDMRVLIVTKSDIVARDVDLLSEMRCAVSVSISTLKFFRTFEPNAVDPEMRIRAMKVLKDNNIPVILRLDPVIPFKTENEIDSILNSCDFVDHVVSSTLKLRYDSLKRVISSNPELSFFRNIYLNLGEKIQNSFYLPAQIRRDILNAVKEKCEEMGISYAFCREGFRFRAGSCDGTHLIK
ncbi:DNA repair photolyase [Archaeoglobus sulfaticallidus PM70-1]|uniref:DNA repair photolyase n=1 Tax=Archaeoglobus sulfaticallidus PM70-1 TaxID=387631 RepID=N0BAW0_9EURY|nr:radical SAM protein [Archaeoglobus sulfaticallidus]AGK60133.1 DNA repair photolyase [Archaeoglobus sulfaticallidus PM70-1]